MLMEDAVIKGDSIIKRDSLMNH